MGKRMVCLLLCLLCALPMPGCTKREQAETANETKIEAAPEPEAPAAEAAIEQEEEPNAKPLPFLLGCTAEEAEKAEPQVLNWNGTDMDGMSYDWQTHERIEYEFADFNLQLCGQYGENDAQKQRLIPVSFAFVSAEAAIIEGHIEQSPIFQREAAAEDTSGFEPCPFEPSAAGSAVMREDWYDNGVFSSYAAAAYPGCTWNYAGTILDITGDNPYDYAGYDLYCLYDGDTERWFLTPYSQYAPAPVAYRYLTSENGMKLVFQDGTLLD